MAASNVRLRLEELGVNKWKVGVVIGVGILGVAGVWLYRKRRQNTINKGSVRGFLDSNQNADVKGKSSTSETKVLFIYWINDNNWQSDSHSEYYYSQLLVVMIFMFIRKQSSIAISCAYIIFLLSRTNFRYIPASRVFDRLIINLI